MSKHSGDLEEDAVAGGTMRIGFETTPQRLREEILAHPEMFFYILVLRGRAALCVSTCNSSGEEIEAHEIDGLVPDSDGSLVSLLQPPLMDAVVDQRSPSKEAEDWEIYPITPMIGDVIRAIPGLGDWMLQSALSNGRNIIIRI